VKGRPPNQIGWVISLEGWALIRHLHRSEGLSQRAIAKQLGIVGYSIGSRMRSRLDTRALHSAVAEAASGWLHSAQRSRSQFRSTRFVHALSHPEMGSAAVENCGSLLQQNDFDRRRWDTREQRSSDRPRQWESSWGARISRIAQLCVRR